MTLRRLRSLSVFAAAVVGLLMVGTAVAGWKLMEADRQVQAAQAELLTAQTDIALAQRDLGIVVDQLALADRLRAEDAQRLSTVRSRLAASEQSLARTWPSGTTVTVEEGADGQPVFRASDPAYERRVRERAAYLRRRAAENHGRTQVEVGFTEPSPEAGAAPE